MRLAGVDVGGTKVSVGWLQDGVFAGPELTPTRRDAGSEGLVDQLVEVIEGVRTDDLGAVGVGVPSVIEWTTGRVKSSANIPLRDVALREVLRERLELPVYVDNDANVAALSEAHEEATLVHRDLVMITVGTGVGGGIVIGGQIYRGTTGGGGELGHVLIGAHLEEGAPPASDHWPQAGSLEALGAGTALDRLAGGRGRGPAVVDAAHAGDEDARRLVCILGERLGIGVANVINTFDPEVVAIGGGVARAGELLLEPIRRVASGYVLPGIGERTEIRLARWGAEAGVRGAALLAAQELQQEEEA